MKQRQKQENPTKKQPGTNQMQTEQEEQTKIKAEIAGLRKRFAKLKAICSLQAINQKTIMEYIKEIQILESQLKGGEEK